MAARNQAKAKQQEKRITRSLKQVGEEARRQAFSGSIWFLKSDVISTMFRIEAKTRLSPAKSITIKKEWFDKIKDEAITTHKIPAIVFSFGDAVDYFCLESRDFLALIEELLILRKGGGED